MHNNTGFLLGRLLGLDYCGWFHLMGLSDLNSPFCLKGAVMGHLNSALVTL